MPIIYNFIGLKSYNIFRVTIKVFLPEFEKLMNNPIHNHHKILESMSRTWDALVAEHAIEACTSQLEVHLQHVYDRMQSVVEMENNLKSITRDDKSYYCLE